MNTSCSRKVDRVGRVRREQKGETTSYGKQARVSYSSLSRLVGFFSLGANRLQAYGALTIHEAFL